MTKTVEDVRIAELLKLKYVELELKGRNKEEIIEELVEIIAKSGKVKNKKAFAEALLERERLGSTAIGNGVAIPHVKIDSIDEPILVFARSSDGVDFNSLDGELTKIFFMLASAKEDIGIHLKILAKISRIIKDKFTVGLFKKAGEKREVIEVLANAEKHIDG